MQFTEKSGTILDSTADAIVVPVCCVGMVGGLFEAVADKYSGTGYLDNYVLCCDKEVLAVGKPCVFDLGKDHANPRYIAHFPSHHAPGPSKLDEVRAGLDDLVAQIAEDKPRNIKHVVDGFGQIESVAVSAIGCGIGGLEWYDVRNEVKEAFNKTALNVEFWKPLGK